VSARHGKVIDTATRHMQLGARAARGEQFTTAKILREYGVSVATAKRDLVSLEYALGLRRERIDHTRRLRVGEARP
jgi:DeoR/GlpR family transcriptional regulator of sugar metabolism